MRTNANREFHSPAGNSKKGITLVEMVVAFALLAIVVILLAGPIAHILRTTTYTASKSKLSYKTAGELLRYFSNGGEEPIKGESLLTIQFETGLTQPIGGYTYTETSDESIANSNGKHAIYKIFVYSNAVTSPTTAPSP